MPCVFSLRSSESTWGTNECVAVIGREPPRRAETLSALDVGAAESAGMRGPAVAVAQRDAKSDQAAMAATECLRTVNPGPAHLTHPIILCCNRTRRQ